MISLSSYVLEFQYWVHHGWVCIFIVSIIINLVWCFLSTTMCAMETNFFCSSTLGRFGRLVSEIVNFTSLRDPEFMINIRMTLLNFNKRRQKVSIVAWNCVRFPQYDLVARAQIVETTSSLSGEGYVHPWPCRCGSPMHWVFLFFFSLVSLRIDSSELELKHHLQTICYVPKELDIMWTFKVLASMGQIWRTKKCVNTSSIW